MKKIEEKVFDNIIYIAFFVYICTVFVNSTALYLENNYVTVGTKIIRYICYIFFVLNTIRVIYKEKNITICNLIFFLIGLAILIIGKNPEFLIVFFVVNSVRNLDLKKIIKNSLIIYVILFLLTILLSIFKILPDWIYFRGNITRHSLGFLYPTDLISIYVTIVLLYFYVRNSKATYVELIILELLAIILYNYTNGRLGFIIASLILFIQLCAKIIVTKKLNNKWKIQDKTKKVLQGILKILPIILISISIIITILFRYNVKIADDINNILSNRINYNNKAFSTYPITPFGANIDWIGWGGNYGKTAGEIGYNYIDMSYIRIIFYYGIIGTAFVLYSYIKSLNYCIKNNENILLICLTIILMWSFIEPMIFYTGRNLFILFIGEIIANNENKKLFIKKGNIDGE